MYQAELYYGYQKTEEGVYHAFILEDPNNPPDPDQIADELAALLDTTPEDERFNWNSMLVGIPDTVANRLKEDGISIASATRVRETRSYTIDSFRPKMYSKAVKDIGYISGKNVESNINYSSVLTKLIQVAGRLVDHYASDVLISWSSILDDLAQFTESYLDPAIEEQEYKASYLFGFRDMGVDHTNFVLSKYNAAETYNNRYGAGYREIWKLDLIVSTDGRISLELYEVDKLI